MDSCSLSSSYGLIVELDYSYTHATPPTGVRNPHNEVTTCFEETLLIAQLANIDSRFSAYSIPLDQVPAEAAEPIFTMGALSVKKVLLGHQFCRSNKVTSQVT